MFTILIVSLNCSILSGSRNYWKDGRRNTKENGIQTDSLSQQTLSSQTSEITDLKVSEGRKLGGGSEPGNQGVVNTKLSQAPVITEKSVPSYNLGGNFNKAPIKEPGFARYNPNDFDKDGKKKWTEEKERVIPNYDIYQDKGYYLPKKQIEDPYMNPVRQPIYQAPKGQGFGNDQYLSNKYHELKYFGLEDNYQRPKIKPVQYTPMMNDQNRLAPDYSKYQPKIVNPEGFQKSKQVFERPSDAPKIERDTQGLGLNIAKDILERERVIEGPSLLSNHADGLKYILESPSLAFRIGIIDNGRQMKPTVFQEWENYEPGSIQTVLDAYQVVLQEYQNPLSFDIISKIRNKLSGAKKGSNFENPLLKVNDMTNHIRFGILESNIEEVRDFMRSHQKDFNKRMLNNICPSQRPDLKKYCINIEFPEPVEGVSMSTIDVNKIISELAMVEFYYQEYKMGQQSYIQSGMDITTVQKRLDSEIRVCLGNANKLFFDSFLARNLRKVYSEFVQKWSKDKLTTFNKMFDNFEAVIYQNRNQLDNTDFVDRRLPDLIKIGNALGMDSQKLTELEAEMLKYGPLFGAYKNVSKDLRKLMGTKDLKEEELEVVMNEFRGYLEYEPYFLEEVQKNGRLDHLFVWGHLSKPTKKAMLEVLIENYNRNFDSSGSNLKPLFELITDLERIHPYNDFNARTFGALILNKELLRMNQPPSFMKKVEVIDFAKVTELGKYVKEGQDFYRDLSSNSLDPTKYPSNRELFLNIESVKQLVYFAKNGNFYQFKTEDSKHFDIIVFVKSQFSKIKQEPFFKNMIDALYQYDIIFKNFILLTKEKSQTDLMLNPSVQLFESEIIKAVKQSVQYQGQDPMSHFAAKLNGYRFKKI